MKTIETIFKVLFALVVVYVLIVLILIGAQSQQIRDAESNSVPLEMRCPPRC